MPVKSWIKTIVCLASCSALFLGCDMFSRRSSSGDDGKDARAVADGNAKAGTDAGSDDGDVDSDVDEIHPIRYGKEVEDTEAAQSGTTGVGAAGSWISTTKPRGDGSFLVAATSHKNTSGGDMIRRIDLGKNIREFDYDDEKSGAQGAYIYVSDEIRSAVPNKYIDSDGFFTGEICALIPGPNKTVIALAGGSEAGVGFVINPYEEAAAFTPVQAFKIPHSSSPCRAAYSPSNKKLYIVDVASTEATRGREGIFSVDITLDGRGSTATFYQYPMGARINSHSIANFQGVKVFNDRLYLLSGYGRFDAEWDEVVYIVPMNAQGEPLFEQREFQQTNNPIFRSDGCAHSSNNIGALEIVEQPDRAVLLTTGTAATMAWEILPTGLLKKIDMNEKKPGVQGVNLEENAQGGLKLQYSPDGKTLYQIPHCRSNKKKIKIDANTEAFAFFLTTFSVPDLKRLDPVDIGYRDFLASLTDVKYRPMFTYNIADGAIGKRHAALIGNSGGSQSGLGSGGDVLIIDLQKKSNLVFGKVTDKRTAHENSYGFKLGQGDSDFEGISQRSHAVMWIP